jgi:hypothetical protein
MNKLFVIAAIASLALLTSAILAQPEHLQGYAAAQFTGDGGPGIFIIRSINLQTDPYGSPTVNKDDPVNATVYFAARALTY